MTVALPPFISPVPSEELKIRCKFQNHKDDGIEYLIERGLCKAGIFKISTSSGEDLLKRSI